MHACTPFDAAGACTDRCPEDQSCASMLCQAERAQGAACDAPTEPLCDETCKLGRCATFCDDTGTLRGACAPGLACGVNDPFPPYRCSPIP